MEKAKLNEWAARFIGEDDGMVRDAISTEWYTTMPSAAMSLLVKAVNEGKKVELEIGNGKVKAKCGEAEEIGSADDLALLVTTACFRCHNG